MALFGDGLKNIISKVDEMRVEYLTMSANFKNLEKAFEKFVGRVEIKINSIESENESLRRRITELEAIVNATLKISMKEAVQVAIREHLEDKESFESINSEKIINRISGDNPKPESNEDDEE